MKKDTFDHNQKILYLRNQIDEMLKEMTLGSLEDDINLTNRYLKRIESLKRQINSIKVLNVQNNYTL